MITARTCALDFFFVVESLNSSLQVHARVDRVAAMFTIQAGDRFVNVMKVLRVKFSQFVVPAMQFSLTVR